MWAEKGSRRVRVCVGNEKKGENLSKRSTLVRDKLRSACREVDLFPPPPLLVPVVPRELDSLLKCPPDAAGYTCFVVLADDKHGW